MNKIEAFKTLFDSTFDNADEFMDKAMYSDNPPLGGKLEQDLDQYNSDSYGSESNTILRRIYYFPILDIYIEFYGTRSSYSGSDWEGYKEVQKQVKTITTWE